MKTDKNSVEGQLDIFEAMNRAARAVDRMVENTKDSRKARKKQSDEQATKSEDEKGTTSYDTVKQPQIIRGDDMVASLKKVYINTITDDFAMVAYIDYNMVYLKDWNAPASLRRFGNSKDAVDYYIEEAHRLASTEYAKDSEEEEPFLDVKYVMENVYVECE